MSYPGQPTISRRALLQSGLGASALSLLLSPRTAGAQTTPSPHFAPKARRAIWLFMAGGPSQVDLFDHKPMLAARAGEDLPESFRKAARSSGMTSNQAHFPLAPSRWAFERVGRSGAWMSELLPNTRRIADELAIVHSVSTEAVNHDLATSSINTGVVVAGKPSVGAWLSYGLGRLQDDVPTYAVLTSSFSVKSFVQALPARVWGSGFLPATHGGVPIRGVGDPVLFLQNPPGVSPEARRAALDAIGGLNSIARSKIGDPSIDDRTAQFEQAFRMQSSVPDLTDLSRETAATLDAYGPDSRTPGTFAANCVAARRMLEKGVRMVQIYHRS
jgi:hypothetical protein